MAPRGTYSKHQIDAIRERVPISEVVGRFVLWDKRKSNPRRGDLWACCPFHGEKSPSFHVDDRKAIYKCFGCGVSGDVFGFLMAKTGCTFPEAVAQLGGEIDEIDIDPAERAKRDREAAARQEAARAAQLKDEADVRESARGIWRQTGPIAGTLAEAYLRGRGIDFPLEQFVSLRFHGALAYREKGVVIGKFAALVAGVRDPMGEFCGIWRIYLDERGNKAPVENPKLGLGAYTEVGGSVWLGEPDRGEANLTEGIETGLGVFGITGRPVQACLNTSGLVNWRPSPEHSRALIWPDGDVDRIRKVSERERKIESPGLRAAEELRGRLEAEDFPAAIQPTPKNGRDYLDVFNQMRKRLSHGKGPS